MNQKYNNNLGDDIKNILQDALNTNNFGRLNQDISRTVKDALRDAESMFTGKPKYTDPDILWKPLAREEPKNDFSEEPPRYTEHAGATNHSGTTNQKADFRTKDFRTGKEPNNSAVIAQKPSGRVSSILFMVFGFLGVAIFGIGLAIYTLVAVIAGLSASVNAITAVTILPFFGASIVFAGVGVQSRRRLNRFKRYILKINGRTYCDIKELAQLIGKPEKFVADDLQKMIHIGYFLQGHIDEEKTCLMLDDSTYKQYLETKKWAQEQQKIAESQQEELAKKRTAQENEDEAQKALRITIEEGKSYIAQIKKANDDIPGEEVSQKLDRLEIVTSKIFQHIETHPEQIPEIRKFMNYYLPTTLKLTSVYSELDNQPIEGENISTAKEEIQKTLDTINTAFENLFDNLFYHAAMDVSSDISVLETMLAQEGLTEKDFNTQK